MSGRSSIVTLALVVAVLAVPVTEICAMAAKMAPDCPMMRTSRVAQSPDAHESTAMAPSSPCHQAPAQPADTVADCCLIDGGSGPVEVLTTPAPQLLSPSTAAGLASILAITDGRQVPPLLSGQPRPPRDRRALLSTYLL